MDLQPESAPDSKPGTKPPVIRGARACTVCRAAKMKCVGAEDGQGRCQRCKRANVECVFEKHRRGRKPGSKLSEASKMLRRLEKGLNNAKLKSQTTEQALAASLQAGESRASGSQDGNYQGYTTQASRNMDVDDEEDNQDRDGENIFPAKLIKRENQRNSFFRLVLNEETPATNPPSNRANTTPEPPKPAVPGLKDPIEAGIIDDEQAKVLFDLIFLRLNPFINLFDPALHTVNYVRSKCPFLFTTLIMAGCKFFKPELFKTCQKLANEYAVRAFAEAWKRVEVVQAFACLTYWKDPDDNRTWTYIGYACRMAVELGLNRYVPHPPANESEFQLLERRNRERTYLVLFVHDRSLSTQTGRHWMLPEDELIRHSSTWHEQGGANIRPEDVIVAAFVALRRIAAETTDIFNAHRGNNTGSHNDVNYDVVLRNCNSKLTTWAETWQREMERAGGDKFHTSFLNFFRLYVRLFLNSFGVQASMSPTSHTAPSVQALSACSSSALDSLRIICKDFATMSMLRYGQDSITVMSAYSAVFLLKLLRSSNTVAQLPEGTAAEIYALISKTADAYYDASVLSPASTSAAYHARFLRSLVENDVFKIRRADPPSYDNGMPIDPRLQAPQSGPPTSHSIVHTNATVSPSTDNNSATPPGSAYPQHQVSHPSHEQYAFPPSPQVAGPPQTEEEYVQDINIRPMAGAGVGAHHNYPGYAPAVPQHASELDAHYWKNMFLELGFGDQVDPATLTASAVGHDDRTYAQYMDASHQQAHYPQAHHHQHPQAQSHPHHPQHSHHPQVQHPQHPQQMSYHHSVHAAAPPRYTHQA
ncbi:hypothetical protein AX16_004195 [Volvariella volvacea WC 439]|nr:hypothetical protein AX16_004195 [Volvariella volvacea WC 439]